MEDSNPLIQDTTGCRNAIVFNIWLGVLTVSTGGFYLGRTLKVLHPVKGRFQLLKGSMWVCFLKRKGWLGGSRSIPSKSAHNLKNKTSSSAKFSLLAEFKTYHHLIISPVLGEFLKEKKKSPNYLNSEAWKAAKENCIFSITTTCASPHTPFHKSWIMVYCVPSRNTDSPTSSHWHGGVLEQKATSLWVSLHWVPILTSCLILNSCALNFFPV